VFFRVARGGGGAPGGPPPATASAMRFSSVSQWARHVRAHRFNYLFISLAVLGVLFFKIGPMLASLVFSLTRYDVLSAPRFVGLSNFVRLVSDPRFLVAAGNTVFYVLAGLPVRLLVALGAAILLNQRIRGIGVFRTIFYLPAVTAGVAISLLWKLIYEPGFGLLSSALTAVGVTSPGWLSSPVWAMPSIIIMMAFNIGQFMLIFLGGLQNVPDQLYEAVALDGGGEWRKFVHVTLPHLTPVLFFNIVIGLIDMMQMFTQVYVLTQGGPLDATLVYVLYIYETAFQSLKMGYASALSWVLFVALFAFTLLQFRISRGWVYYRSGSEARR
jgi:multiple sugar transport system permease protein